MKKSNLLLLLAALLAAGLIAGYALTNTPNSGQADQLQPATVMIVKVSDADSEKPLDKAVVGVKPGSYEASSKPVFNLTRVTSADGMAEFIIPGNLIPANLASTVVSVRKAGYETFAGWFEWKNADVEIYVKLKPAAPKTVK